MCDKSLKDLLIYKTTKSKNRVCDMCSVNFNISCYHKIYGAKHSHKMNSAFQSPVFVWMTDSINFRNRAKKT